MSEQEPTKWETMLDTLRWKGAPGSDVPGLLTPESVMNARQSLSKRLEPVLKQIEEDTQLQAPRMIVSHDLYEQFTGMKVENTGERCPGLFNFSSALDLSVEYSDHLEKNTALKFERERLVKGIFIPKPAPPSFEPRVDCLMKTAPISVQYKRAVIIDTSVDYVMSVWLRNARKKLRYLKRTAKERGFISPRLAKRIRTATLASKGLNSKGFMQARAIPTRVGIFEYRNDIT